MQVLCCACSGAGIQVTPEYNCCEAGFVTDVTIRNNVIDSFAMGIWVGGSTEAEGDKLPTPYRHNKNIVIENNSISHSQKTPFIVTSSQGVVVSFRSTTTAQMRAACKARQILLSSKILLADEFPVSVRTCVIRATNSCIDKQGLMPIRFD